MVGTRTAVFLVVLADLLVSQEIPSPSLRRDLSEEGRHKNTLLGLPRDISQSEERHCRGIADAQTASADDGFMRPDPACHNPAILE